jgi:hypothetical protein
MVAFVWDPDVAGLVFLAVMFVLGSVICHYDNTPRRPR